MNPTTKKYLMIAGVVLAVIGIYWFFFRKPKPATTEAATGTNTTGTGTTKPAAGKPAVQSAAALGNAEFPLQQGSRGQQVLHVQAFLNLIKGENLVLDGIFGPATEAAVNRAFPMGNKKVSWSIYTNLYSTYRNQITYYLRSKNWQLL